jgi:hypothetical protein
LAVRDSALSTGRWVGAILGDILPVRGDDVLNGITKTSELNSRALLADGVRSERGFEGTDGTAPQVDNNLCSL